MKTLQYQGMRVKKSCDILRHGFCNSLNSKGLKGAFCDMICRKFATFRVAKYGLQITVKQLIIKMMSQNVATKNGFKYLNSS